VFIISSLIGELCGIKSYELSEKRDSLFIDLFTTKFPSNLIHLAVKTQTERDFEKLRRCIQAIEVYHCLIFMNFQRYINNIAAKLTAYNMEAEVLYGKLAVQNRKMRNTVTCVMLACVSNFETLIFSLHMLAGLNE